LSLSSISMVRFAPGTMLQDENRTRLTATEHNVYSNDSLSLHTDHNSLTLGPSL